ncbi:MAG: hypothetical protein WA151_14875 [Desulfatirhabdiaceae bacterium]
MLDQALTPVVEQQLDTLLQADEGMYRISAFKHEPKDFSYKELRQEVERRKFFQPIHDFAQYFLAMAGISNESGKYYASLVKFYTVYKLQRMARAQTRLYLLCFAYHRFRQINDNLIEAFCCFSPNVTAHFSPTIAVELKRQAANITRSQLSVRMSHAIHCV